ncbi:MAG: cereblon family protein [Gammaproteobacteria bacterium]|nr:cereblon family protein [Gammaproteobacteria bacterium]
MLKRFNEQAEPHTHRPVGVGNRRDLLCVRCLAPVTSETDRIRVNGTHTHAVVNPHDIRFEIACFRTAHGCRSTGAPTSEFTWFPGFRWRIALCARCTAHLGWSYSDGSPNAEFFGLILDRLRPAEDN